MNNDKKLLSEVLDYLGKTAWRRTGQQFSNAPDEMASVCCSRLDTNGKKHGPECERAKLMRRLRAAIAKAEGC